MNAMISIERMLAASGLLGQATSGRAGGGHLDMAKAPAPSHDTFRANLERLMQSHEPPMSQSALATASGVGQRSIGRILIGEQNPTLEMCDKLARVFRLHTWQMLQPDLDPQHPPILETTSHHERELLARFSDLMNELVARGGKK